MSIAIFQCLGEGRTHELAKHLNLSTEFKGCVCHQMNTLLCVSRIGGHYSRIYDRCMAFADTMPEDVAFIGVDENAKYAADYYSLDELSQMPRLENYRVGKQDICYSFLKYEFRHAIRGCELDYNDFLRIVRSCYLGLTVRDSGAEYIAHLLESMAGIDMSDIEMNSLIEDEQLYRLSAVGHWTMIRVMAHICYLRLSRFNQKGGIYVGSRVASVC